MFGVFFTVSRKSTETNFIKLQLTIYKFPMWLFFIMGLSSLVACVFFYRLIKSDKKNLIWIGRINQNVARISLVKMFMHPSLMEPKQARIHWHEIKASFNKWTVYILCLLYFFSQYLFYTSIVSVSIGLLAGFWICLMYLLQRDILHLKRVSWARH